MVLMLPPKDSINLHYAKSIVTVERPANVNQSDVDQLLSEGWSLVEKPKKKTKKVEGEK